MKLGRFFVCWSDCNSEYLLVEIGTAAVISIKLQHDGVAVDVFDTESDEPVASTWAMWSELSSDEEVQP